MTSPNRQMNSGCLFLFCLPFAGVGVFMLGWLAVTLATHLEMKHWEEVPAFIQKTELKKSTSTDSDGHTSTTFQTTATYTYEFGDRHYTSSKVSLHSGSDNLGSYQQRIYQELRQYRQSKDSFRCFVNPENPTKAVLYRDLRLEMLGFQALFGLVFGGAGFGMMIFSFRSLRKTKSEKKSNLENPHEPWLWKQDWTAGCIRSSSKTKMVTLIVFALFWNAVSCPILFILPGELDKGNHLALIGLLFPAVGLGLIIAAAYQIIRWFKYGDSIFEMSTFPGFLGDSLQGVIHTKVNIISQEGFALKLSCINRAVRGSGKNRSTSERILWQDSGIVKHELLEGDSSQSAIPVHFALPGDQPASSTEKSSNEVIWRLETNAVVPGVDYAAAFEIPVFQSDKPLKNEPSTANFAVENETLDLVTELQRQGIAMKQTIASGFELDFPMARNKKVAAGVLAFFLIWTGGIALMLHLGAPLFFLIVFGIFDLLFLSILIPMLFYSSHLVVGPGQLTLSGGFLGMGPTRKWTTDEIADIIPKQSLQAGNTVYYKIQLRSSDGKTCSLGAGISNQRLVKQLIEEILIALDP